MALTRQDKDAIAGVAFVMGCIVSISIGMITGPGGVLLIPVGVMCGMAGGWYLRWATIGR